jgi:hypothetical protein
LRDIGFIDAVAIKHHHWLRPEFSRRFRTLR